METGMLHLHSILRYLVLLFALWAIIKMAGGMNGGKTFTKSDKRPAMLFMIFMDIQLLIGMYLYFFGSWGINLIQKSSSMGDVMKNSVARFFAVEHIAGMIIALILVHIGYAAVKKPISDKKKFKSAFWYFLIALIVILVSIPWPFRMELGRGWFAGMS